MEEVERFVLGGLAYKEFHSIIQRMSQLEEVEWFVLGGLAYQFRSISLGMSKLEEVERFLLGGLAAYKEFRSIILRV